MIEQLACKIGEGFQASSLTNTEQKINAFHRTVATHESSDLSFINGLVSTGLRGTALLDGNKVINNYNQLLTASRQHLALVVNTNARVVNQANYSTFNNYGNINAIQQAGCFQLIANSLQEEIFLTLIAHRIAELSLIPGIVIADYTPTTANVALPADNLIIKYLGNPDEQIPCPTPAQEIIFGKTRRRIPNWYSLDVPVMLGAKKDGAAISFEAAASQKYFYEHLPQLIKQAYQEFNEVFGASLSPITTKGSSSEYAVLSIGGQANELFDEISGTKNSKLLIVNQLSPFPTAALSELIKGMKAVTILENVSGSSTTNSSFYYNVLNALNNSNVKVYSGKYSADLDANSFGKAIQHMVSNQNPTSYYLGLQFTKADSSYPKHDILLKEISKQYTGIGNEAINDNSSKNDTSANGHNEVPLAVRMYQDKGPNYSRLSRFYNDTAFFYENGEYSELVADPFAALPVAPSATASFFSQSSKRKTLPIFDSQKCTGCGDCFVMCPHSALPPLAIGVEQLMRAGANIAGTKGVTITKLTPMMKNLAKAAAKTVKNAEVSSLTDFLPQAFDNLAAQMKLEGEKLAAAKSEFDIVLKEVEGLPVAITDQFFTNPSTIEKGSGELFSLTVNPTACTACSICVEACAENALTMENQEVENLTKINEQFRLWEQLPDTAGNTINRLYRDDDYNSLAAMMLSRNYYMAMSGASFTEEDNSYKTLLHIVTATAESVVQPKILKQLKYIDELIQSLSDNVHSKLSDALPKDNLEALSSSLKKANGRKLSIQTIVNDLSEQGQGKLVDTTILERKTDLIDSLKNLKWVLAEGPTGVGRSRYGMLMSGTNSMEWAKQYPANNFTNPSVIHWNGSAPEQTLGLFYGQLRYLIDNIKLMRRAVLESKDKYDPTVHNKEIATLSWADLSDDEKALIPPLLLVAERDDLNESGWSSLNKLLAEEYPVKVFLFDHIASPNNAPVANLAQTASGMFSSIALKNAYVYQGGMGDTNNLFNALMTGMDRIYPALFNLYATKFEKHGVTNIDWSPYAALAQNSRAFPTFCFDPEDKNNFLTGVMNVDANREKEEDWIQEEISISEEESIHYSVSWADWAFTQEDWKSEFSFVEEGVSNLLVTDYIKLGVKKRKGLFPVILRVGNDGLKYYSLSEKAVAMTEAILANWNTLQLLAGVNTEIPVELKEELTNTLTNKYEKEAAKLKENYEEQLRTEKAAQTEVLRQRLKEKLIALSAMAQNKMKV